jgi:hypothetical protein
VVTTVSNPPDGETSRARVLGFDVVAISTASRLGCVLGLAAVNAQVAVTETTALADVEDRVHDTMNAEVGDLGLSTCATTELRACNDRNSTEHIYTERLHQMLGRVWPGRFGVRTGTRASKVVRHPATVTKPSGEDLPLIDAKTIVDLVENLVNELRVAIASVCPTLIKAIGGDEDRGLLREVAKTIVTRGDIVHVATEPMKAEDEFVASVRVVVGRNLEDVLTAADVPRPTG